MPARPIPDAEAGISTGEAARRCGISRHTVLRAARRGDLAPVRRTPGGDLRFHPDDVVAFAARLTAAAGMPGKVGARHVAARRARELAGLLDLAHDAVIVREPSTSAVAGWNRGAEQLYGWTAAEAAGLITHELLATTFPDSREAVDRALAEDGTWQGELTHTARDGRAMVVESRQVLRRGADGRPEAVLEINRDITERRRAEVVARAEADRLAAIVATQQEIATAGTDLERVLELIAERAQALTGGDGAAIEMAEGDEMVYRATSGSRRSYNGTRLPQEGTLTGLCLRSGEILQCADGQHDPRTDPALCLRQGIGSMILVPLLRGRDVIGVLKVTAAAPHAFAPRDVQTLELMAGLLGAAMDQALSFDANQTLLREYQAMMDAMDQSEQRAHTLIEKSPLGTCIVDEHGIFETVNPTYAAIYGYGPEEMLGKPCTMILPEERRDAFMAQVRARLDDGQDDAMEYDGVGKDRQELTIWSTGVTISGADGRPRRASFIMDITARKQAERQLTHAAHHDGLTGLPNRVLFDDRLEQALRAADRDRTPLAMLLIDLDGFKAVNDSLGHAAGDTLLQVVSARLQAAVRGSDTVARQGGDEFAVLLTQAGEAGAVRVASKIRIALAEPVVVSTGTAHVGGSVGIALYPDHGEDAETLKRCADHAMYAAKRAGGGYLVFGEEQEGSETALRGLGVDLRRAVVAGELRLHYQPVMRCTTGTVERVEALVRWEHPRLGLLAPDRFIPAAERTGAITPLTVWVLEEAIRQCAAWRERGLGLGVAVNISPITLEEPQFADLVAALLRRYALPPTDLTLEITESTLLSQPDRAVAALGALAHIGVRLSIDDFGSGYSSIAQLRRLPVDELKLDRAFLADLSNEKNTALLAFLLGLGIALSVQVVVEGVETQTMWEWLESMNGELAQGYHMCRPQPPDQIERWLEAEPWRVAGHAG